MSDEVSCVTVEAESSPRLDAYIFVYLDFDCELGVTSSRRSVFLRNVPERLHQRIVEAAHKDGVSLSAWILETLKGKLDSIKDSLICSEAEYEY